MTKTATKPEVGRSTNATKHESSNKIQRLLVSRLNRTLVNQVVKARPKRLLDVGCGEGFIALEIKEKLPELHIQGLDLSEEAVEEFNVKCKNKNAKAVTGSIYKLPFADNSFDVVLCSEVLEHLEDPRAGLAEIARVVDGSVILTVPWEPMFTISNLMRGKYLSRLGNHPEHVQRWSMTLFEDMVDEYLRITEHQLIYPWQMVVGWPRGKRNSK